MKYKQFEIWTADLNPSIGTEAGKRPVLIVQSNLLNEVHPSILICPITTKVRKRVSILRVNISNQTVSGLKEESAVMIDQLRAIDKKRLIKKIGDLPLEIRTHVKENMKIVMDLD